MVNSDGFYFSVQISRAFIRPFLAVGYMRLLVQSGGTVRHNTTYRCSPALVAFQFLFFIADGS